MLMACFCAESSRLLLLFPCHLQRRAVVNGSYNITQDHRYQIFRRYFQTREPKHERLYSQRRKALNTSRSSSIGLSSKRWSSLQNHIRYQCDASLSTSRSFGTEDALKAFSVEVSSEYQTFLQKIKKPDVMLPDSEVASTFKCSDVKLGHISKVLHSASDQILEDEDFRNYLELKLSNQFDAFHAFVIVTSLAQRGVGNVEELIDRLIEGLLKSKKFQIQEVYSFIYTLTENNFPMIPMTFSRVLNVLRKENLSKSFVSLVRLMKEQRIQLHVHHYYEMLALAAQNGNSMAAEVCFQKIQAEPLSHQVLNTFHVREYSLYDLAINAYGKDKLADQGHLEVRKQKNATKVMELFDEMVSKGFKPTIPTVQSTYKALLLGGELERANALIRKHDTGWNSLRLQEHTVTAFLNNNEFEKAENLFNKIRARSQSRACVHGMMRMYGRNNQVAKVEELYKETVRKKMTPDVWTYHLRIQAHLNSNKPIPCVGIVEQCVRDFGGTSLYGGTLMSVIRQLILVGDVDGVERIADIVLKFHPDVPKWRVHDALMLVNIKIGDFEKASCNLSFRADSTDKNVLAIIKHHVSDALEREDLDYVCNIKTFLAMNEISTPAVDEYLTVLNEESKKE